MELIIYLRLYVQQGIIHDMLIHVSTKLLGIVLALRLDQLLGRRRLWEWRKGGYHTKLKAPLDDVPHGSKEGRLPIEETVGCRFPLYAFCECLQLAWNIVAVDLLGGLICSMESIYIHFYFSRFIYKNELVWRYLVTCS